VKPVLWFLGLIVLLRLVRYLLAARTYLTSAINAVSVRVCEASEIETGESELLQGLDSEAIKAGFRPLGYVAVAPLLSHYDQLEFSRMFAHEVKPMSLIVGRHLSPEYGTTLVAEVATVLMDGRLVRTGNGWPVDLGLPGVVTELLSGSELGALVARHQVRLEGHRADIDGDALMFLDGGAALVRRLYTSVHDQYRAWRWIVPAGTDVDRVTLRGVVGMVGQSMRVFGKKGAMSAAGGLRSEANRRERVEADYQAVRHVARFPRAAPGVPWPALSLMGATAVVSVIAMALLWNLPVALLIFAVLVLHEGGHALAMRWVGHSAIQVFFLPLLGAFTVGRADNPTARQRVAILLAGPGPGLLLSVVLFWWSAHGGWAYARVGGLAFLLINALNLLPVVPFDGGRVFETFTRPESVARLVIQAGSGVGLAMLAWWLKDPVVAGFAALAAVSWPKQLLAYRFRRAVAARVTDRSNWLGVVRAACEEMTEPAFVAWRGPTRQAYARYVADQLGVSEARAGDRMVGILAYSACVAMAVVGLGMWAATR